MGTYLHQLVLNGAGPGVRRYRTNLEITESRKVFFDSLSTPRLGVSHAVDGDYNTLGHVAVSLQRRFDSAAGLPVALLWHLHELTPLGWFEGRKIKDNSVDSTFG